MSYIQTDVVDVDGKMVLVATIQRGRNKPYKDLAGHIWVKQGADKRRVTENSELLSLFQDSGIPRVLAEDSHVEFIDSKEGNQFTVRISRPLTASEAGSSTEKAGSNEKKAVSNDEKAVSSGKKAVSKKEAKEQKLLAFCKEPKSLSEICEHLGMTDRYKVKKRYIDPILNKLLRMTEPESPKSPTQKYVAI